MTEKSIIASIEESAKTIRNLASISKNIDKIISVIIESIESGHKVVTFGNGGSAADAQHIAAEFIGRFKIERKSFPAIALTTDTSILTSIANDYSLSVIFSRQCESIVNKGDVVIGISTSGNSMNVIKGLKMAKKRGGITIGFLGSKGGKIKQVVDYALIVNSSSTPRIQEAHRTIYHIVCENVEKVLSQREIND